MESKRSKIDVQVHKKRKTLEKLLLCFAVSNLNSMCGDRLWAFERVVGAFLEDFDDREDRNVQTKTECEKLCLFETSFTCRYNAIENYFQYN